MMTLRIKLNLALRAGDETVSMLVESKPDSYYYVLVKSYTRYGGTMTGAYELVIREEK